MCILTDCFVSLRDVVSPVIESQLKSLRQRFKERTASFRKQALEPTTPEGSEDEDEGTQQKSSGE